MFDIERVTRKNIRDLVPYSSAREEQDGKAAILLDANENPFDTGYNRYPDPYQSKLKHKLAEIKGVKPSQIFIGNGSDEAIDLLFRAFCEPQIDKAYIFEPTYGMYEVSAKINNVQIVKLQLTEQFDLPPIEDILRSIDSKGILFLCNPNNPTGNTFSIEVIKNIADSHDVIIVVDEAYIDFSSAESATSLLDTTPNLVVLQTLSKAYGMAGLRLGIAFSSKEITAVLNKVKPPYNVNILSQQKGLEILSDIETYQNQLSQILSQKLWLNDQLQKLDVVDYIHPSQANFLLVQFHESDRIFQYLKANGISIRNRSSKVKNCLRITVGTQSQNQLLIIILKKFNR